MTELLGNILGALRLPPSRRGAPNLLFVDVRATIVVIVSAGAFWLINIRNECGSVKRKKMFETLAGVANGGGVRGFRMARWPMALLQSAAAGLAEILARPQR
jgi:hypothetical protein